MQTATNPFLPPTVTLESVKRVHLNRGGYAPDGRYFGQGPVWRITIESGEEHYTRGSHEGAVRSLFAVYSKVQTLTIRNIDYPARVRAPPGGQPTKEVYYGGRWRRVRNTGTCCYIGKPSEGLIVHDD